MLRDLWVLPASRDSEASSPFGSILTLMLAGTASFFPMVNRIFTSPRATLRRLLSRLRLYLILPRPRSRNARKGWNCLPQDGGHIEHLGDRVLADIRAQHSRTRGQRIDGCVLLDDIDDAIDDESDRAPGFGIDHDCNRTSRDHLVSN